MALWSGEAAAQRYVPSGAGAAAVGGGGGDASFFYILAIIVALFLGGLLLLWILIYVYDFLRWLVTRPRAMWQNARDERDRVRRAREWGARNGDDRR